MIKLASPSILKVSSCAIKSYILGKLGYPQVSIEISDDQLEDIIRVSGDFISSYFPNESKLAVFYTQPLIATYPVPSDAWWIEEVSWDPFSPTLDSVFNIDYQLINSGTFGDMHTQVLDIFLMKYYQKFSSKILGKYGRWELNGEVEGGAVDDTLEAGKQNIRLYPTPKGAYPVMVKYCPTINNFRSPQARMLCYDLLVAETKITVGHARRKITNIPGPDGSPINYDGDAMVKEGMDAKDKIYELILLYDQPIPIITY